MMMMMMMTTIIIIMFTIGANLIRIKCSVNDSVHRF